MPAGCHAACPGSAAIPPRSFHTTREAFATLELARAQGWEGDGAAEPFSRVCHSLPGRLTGWILGTRVLSGGRRIPLQPAEAQGQNQASLGEGGAFTTLRQALTARPPAQPQPCPGRGTRNPRELRGQSRGPAGLRRAEPGRTCRGPGKDKGTRGCPCWGTARAPASPRWGRGCSARPLPRPAAAQGALGPAAPAAPLPARPRGYPRT